MRQTSKKIIGTMLFFALQAHVYAATGGLPKATSFVEDLKYGIYGLLGAGSALFLMFVFIQVKLERKRWQDFISSVLWIAAGGGSIALAEFAWGFFK